MCRMHILVLGLGLLLMACTTTGDETATTAVATTPPTTAPNTESTTPTSSEEPGSTTTATPPATTTTLDPESLTIEAFPVPAGSRPHDVAPAAEGGVWYTAQGSGELGWLDPATGETIHIPLGSGSRPHGVIVDEEGTPWVTDGGLNAIVSVDPETDEVTVYALPNTAPGANLNTPAFDSEGILWFTGQTGFVGWLDPATGEMEVEQAPEGRGPYGITATPEGQVFYSSLAGSYVGEIGDNGGVTVHDPPTAGQGARRVWSDSMSRVWVSEWNVGQVGLYDPSTGEWTEWPLPGDNPAAYAVFVDDQDIVWLSDFGANAIVRFDPATETFTQITLPHQPGEVRQLHGRPGEVWGGESAADHLVLISTS